jgi:hypothetical protein
MAGTIPLKTKGKAKERPKDAQPAKKNQIRERASPSCGRKYLQHLVTKVKPDTNSVEVPSITES